MSRALSIINSTPATARRLFWQLASVVGGSLLLILAARWTFYLPFSPVPIALHSAAALFLGIVLGPYLGAAAVMTYLLEGAMGLPVFAGGGLGFATLLGPTGGYLLGFVPGAFIAGMVARSTSSSLRLFAAYLLGMVAVYLCGLPQLALYAGWSRVWMVGLLPFLPGTLVKGAVLVTLLRRCAS